MKRRIAGRAAAGDIKPEYEGADLGDRRLDERLVFIAGRLARHPDMSFPRAADNDAELEATYRFLSNARSTPERILAPHVRETARRSRSARRLVVAHDTTEFNFGKSPRRDLTRVGLGKSFGFYGHFALAIDSGDRARPPLGVLGWMIHQRTGMKGRHRSHNSLQLDPTNERLRWPALVDQVEKTLADQHPIHVMDREGDSYRTLSHLVRRKARFVVRMNGFDRPGVGPAVPDAVMAAAPVVVEREVAISGHGASTMPGYRRAHPPRRARTARLHISAGRVTIKRPASSNRTPERELTLNFVRVFEPKAPRGEIAIEWRLWTTEPIESADDLLAIIDDYRCRWRIEEFFKALKTGCRVEERQLETHHALVNALALLTPIAWRLLRLRVFGTDEGSRPADVVLTHVQLVCLAGALQKNNKPPLPSRPTARDAMMGVAALGGHLKRNGDPGWIVLGRGLDDLLKIELGFTLAREM